MVDSNKAKLIESDEFEAAVSSAVEHNKEIQTSCKSRNKDVYDQFYEIMFNNNEEIQEIASKKKKNRTDSDNEKLKAFKNEVGQVYKQVQDLELREDLEDGQKTKIEKIVGKIVPVVKMLRYIGDNRMEEEFKKHGIKLEFKDLEDENSKLSNEATQQTIKTVLKDAVGIKQKMADESEVIVGNVFEQKVPVELQFNKEDSPDGIKPADFKKLVDVKTKLELAKESAQQKQKTEDQIKKIAEDKTFDIARLELVRDKLLKI